MTKKVALITGINGQTGSYMAELLLHKGYEVHGVLRRSSYPNTQRIDSIFDPESRKYLHYGDLSEGIDHLLIDIKPDEVYNFAAMSHVRISFDIPVYTLDINAVGVCRILEGIRKICPHTKYYQASSSEIFGSTPPPQNEDSKFHPVSPYGIAKQAGFFLTKCYRNGYNIFACNGILMNHESPRRGVNFVTRKITRLACMIKLNMIKEITLGNLDAKRDWGFAGDYVKAIYLIMQHDKPDDFVVSTGEAHTVREFAEEVFKYLRLDLYKYLKTDDICKRPLEVNALLGDSTKIRETLGWKPKIGFKELIAMMVESDLMLVAEGKV